jgi:hypothetical protein
MEQPPQRLGEKAAARREVPGLLTTALVEVSAHRRENGVKAFCLEVAVNQLVDIGGKFMAGLRCFCTKPPLLLQAKVDRERHLCRSEVSSPLHEASSPPHLAYHLMTS